MFGLFSWIRRRRAARTTFPEAWRVILRQEVPFYAQLEPAAAARFEAKLQILVRTKHFAGAAGFEVDDRVRVVVAAAAARLIMNMPGQHYHRLGDIVVYPDHRQHAVRARRARRRVLGLLGEGEHRPGRQLRLLAIDGQAQRARHDRHEVIGGVMVHGRREATHELDQKVAEPLRGIALDDRHLHPGHLGHVGPLEVGGGDEERSLVGLFGGLCAGALDHDNPTSPNVTAMSKFFI